MQFHDEMTLREAGPLLLEAAGEDGGTRCPCCLQVAKVQRRKIHAMMARGLVLLCEIGRGEFVHVPTMAGTSGDKYEISKLRYWGLVEEDRSRRDDGGRTGWWKPTQLGVRWATGEATVPRYALIYSKMCIGLEGDPVSLGDALKDQFDLSEVIAATL